MAQQKKTEEESHDLNVNVNDASKTKIINNGKIVDEKKATDNKEVKQNAD